MALRKGDLSRKALAAQQCRAVVVRERECLRCDRTFVSEGPHHRRCKWCEPFVRSLGPDLGGNYAA